MADSIDDQLKILSEKDRDLLSQFNADFKKNISSLSTVLGDFLQQIGAAKDRVEGRAGGASASASRAPGSTIGGSHWNISGGQSTGGYGGGGGGAPPGPAPPGGADGGGGGFRGWLGNKYNNSAYNNLTDVERESFFSPRFGNYTTQDFLRIASHGLAQADTPVAQHLSRITGMSASLAPYVESTRMMLGRIGQRVNNPLVYGQQVGLSRQGTGYGLFSPAMGESLGSWWDRQKLSWFGRNPFYSSTQAQEANQAISGFGYSGSQRDQFQQVLKSIQIDTGVGGQTAMGILDSGTRFGGSTINDMVKAIYRIPDAARAARLNVEQLAESLNTTAATISSSTGASYAQAFGQLQGFTTATGFDPSRASGLSNNNLLTFMALGMHPKQGIYGIQTGYHSLQYKTQAAQSLVIASAGLPPNSTLSDLGRIIHQGGHSAQIVEDRLQYLYMQNPELFGGFTPREWLRFAAQGIDPTNQQKLQSLMHMGAEQGRIKGSTDFGTLLRVSRLSPKAQHDFLTQEVNKRGYDYIMHHPGWRSATAGLTDTKEHYQSMLKDFSRFIADRDRTRQGGDKAHVQLDLTPVAQRLVYQLPDVQPSQRNSLNDFTKSAYSGRYGHSP